MKKFLYYFHIVGLALSLFVLAACQRGNVENVIIPDAGPILAGMESKEKTTQAGVAELRSLGGAALATSIGTPQEAEVRAIVTEFNATLDKITASLVANPNSEAKELIAQLYKAIDQLKEIIKIRDAEILKLKDANAKVWHWVLYGGATLCVLLSVACFFGGPSVPIIGPMLGPAIGRIFGMFAGTLYVLGYAYDFTQEHPVYTGIIITVFVVAIAGLMSANRHFHLEEKKRA